MLHLLRRHCFVLAVGVLLWQGWSRTQAAAAPAEQDGDPLPPPQRIAAEDAPIRAADAAPFDVKDPFFLANLLQMRAEAEAAENQPEDSRFATGSAIGVAVTAGPGIPVLRVVLQSTMPGVIGRAWINGADLQVGDVVPGADDEAPPVLLAVGGTSVIVEWRGKRFRIDLDGSAPVEEEVQ